MWLVICNAAFTTKVANNQHKDMINIHNRNKMAFILFSNLPGFRGGGTGGRAGAWPP